MPKKVDPKVKDRCVRLVLDHLQEYPSVTAASEAVGRRLGRDPAQLPRPTTQVPRLHDTIEAYSQVVAATLK